MISALRASTFGVGDGALLPQRVEFVDRIDQSTFVGAEEIVLRQILAFPCLDACEELSHRMRRGRSFMRTSTGVPSTTR